MAIRKPGFIYDRDVEWRDLVRFTSAPGTDLRIGLVYGRRRQGKSFLLRALARPGTDVYHQALEEERLPALERLATEIAARSGPPGVVATFRDWVAAFDALLGLRRPGRRAMVVIDEFPYLLRHSRELPSVIQRAYDTAGDAGVSLLLCGSAVSVMSEVIGGTRALRGRVRLDLVLRPFSYRDTRVFWSIDDPAVAFRHHAIFGGTPGYRDLAGSSPPRHPGRLGAWLARTVLDPNHALFGEADLILAEDPAMTARSMYRSVISAIGQGRTTVAGVAAALGRDQGSLHHALRALERAGLIVREDDVLRARRPILRVADPILRLHHTIVRPNIPLLESGRAKEVWSRSGEAFATHILGPHLEDLAREWVLRYASEETLGGTAIRVGPAVVNDPAARRTHQADVVAISRPGSRPRVLVLGEAKATAKRRDVGDLRRLEHIRSVLEREGRADVSGTRLALFAMSGFNAGLHREAAARDDVILVDLERLYEGS